MNHIEGPREVFFISQITVGKQNYFMGYGILLHELPVVAVLFTQSNNNEGTTKNFSTITSHLHTVVHVLGLQNLDVVKYGINFVKLFRLHTVKLIFPVHAKGCASVVILPLSPRKSRIV